MHTVYFLRIFNPAFVSFSLGTSLCNMCAISVDRYLAILHPIWYRNHVTYTTTRLVIICGWLYMLIIIAPLYVTYGVPAADQFHPKNVWPSFLPSKVRIGVIVPNILMLLITSYITYARIFFKLRNRASRIQIAPDISCTTSTQKSSAGGNNTLKPEGNTVAAQASKINRRDAAQLATRRVVVTMATTLGALTLSWLPVTLATLFVEGERYACAEKGGRFYVFSILLLFASSAWNPAIYALRMKSFRKAYIRILKCRH